MRWFFYTFGLILSFALFANDVSASLSESCPYGYRNETTYTERASSYDNQCSSDYYVCSVTASWSDLYGTEWVRFQRTFIQDCAITPRDDINEDGCYPGDVSQNDTGLSSCFGQEKTTCYDSSGNSVQVVSGKTCSNYCTGDNPLTPDRVEQYTQCTHTGGSGEPLTDTDPSDSNCPSGFYYDFSTESCTADNSNTDSGDGGSGSGCISTDTSCTDNIDLPDNVSCSSIDGVFTCQDTNTTGDGSACITTNPNGCIPDTSSGETGGGDTGGGDTGGDTGGGDTGGDTGGGDTGGADTGGDLVGSQSSDCDSRYSCLAAAQSDSDCIAGRDSEFFTYISGNEYFYDCSNCSGLDSTQFSECVSCEYGLNSNTGMCYPATCPYGDCLNPDENNLTPKNNDDNSDFIIAAIRDLQAQVASGIDVNNLNSVTSKLDQISGEIQQKLGEGSSSIVSAIDTLKTSLNNKEFTGDIDLDLVETNDLLTQIKDLEKATNCALGNYDPEVCPAPDEHPEFSHDDEAVALYSRFQSSQWGSALSSIGNSASGVSSSCNLDFDILVPVVNKTMTVSICMFLEPIALILRSFALALWGFMGIRYIFSA